MRLPKKKWKVLRLPMVFGTKSPRIEDIKQQLKDREPIEVFPNLVMNVTTADKVMQQVHYFPIPGEYFQPTVYPIQLPIGQNC